MSKRSTSGKAYICSSLLLFIGDPCEAEWRPLVQHFKTDSWPSKRSSPKEMVRSVVVALEWQL